MTATADHKPAQESTELTDTERTRLHEELDHLLMSLDDLDAERAAGDIDQADYDALRDDYTARAAQLSRILDAGAVRRRNARAASHRQRLGWLATVIVIAGLAAWAMTAFSGARGAGDTASGDIRESTTTKLADAAAAFTSGDAPGAIEIYGEVLELQPTNVEALTYRGWIRYQLGETDAALTDFDDAVAFDPEYGDVRVFRAVVALDDGRFDDASAELSAFDAADPTAVAKQLVEQRQLRERIAVARVLEILDAAPGTPDFESAEIPLSKAQEAGEIFVVLQDPNNALRVFDGILEGDPNHAEALAWRGWTLALTAESGVDELWPDAERWLADAVDADPNEPDARVFRAFVFRRLDRLDEARTELAAFDALDRQPSDMVELIDRFGLRDALAS
ncbi:MAG: tetratricopeptide repeat protein [Acidimicrobiales bacterium]